MQCQTRRASCEPRSKPAARLLLRQAGLCVAVRESDLSALAEPPIPCIEERGACEREESASACVGCVKRTDSRAIRDLCVLPVYGYGMRVYAWPSEIRIWQRVQNLPYQASKIVERVNAKKARPRVSDGGNRKR